MKISKLQHEIQEWSDATFGKDRSPVPILHHLRKEVPELIDALKEMDKFCEQQRDNINGDWFSDINHAEFAKLQTAVLDEFADCFMLLMDAAAHYPITMDAACAAIKRKLEINKKRKWGKPDKNGVCKHIK